jgi:hypothetical protein
MAFVYLISDLEKNNIYKIGVTKYKNKEDIQKRIKKLQTGNGGELHLCRYHESEYPFLIENYLHFIFQNNNIKNEWFELSTDIVNQFNTICNEYEKTIELLKDNAYFSKKLNSS